MDTYTNHAAQSKLAGPCVLIRAANIQRGYYEGYSSHSSAGNLLATSWYKPSQNIGKYHIYLSESV